MFQLGPPPAAASTGRRAPLRPAAPRLLSRRLRGPASVRRWRLRQDRDVYVVATLKSQPAQMDYAALDAWVLLPLRAAQRASEGNAAPS